MGGSIESGYFMDFSISSIVWTFIEFQCHSAVKDILEMLNLKN